MKEYLMVFACTKCSDLKYVPSDGVTVVHSGTELVAEIKKVLEAIPTKHFVNQEKETHFYCGEYKQIGAYKLLPKENSHGNKTASPV
jgi:hypothetical protein